MVKPVDPASLKLIKRSVRVSGHATSIALEEEFWHALEAHAQKEGKSLAQLIHDVDALRGMRNLASALRVFCLRHALTTHS